MQERFGFTPHPTPETICKTCDAKMRPEQAKNGGWLVNCAMCRRLNRRAEHRRFRLRAQELKAEYEKRGITDFARRYRWLASYLNHNCDLAGCK